MTLISLPVAPHCSPPLIVNISKYLYMLALIPFLPFSLEFTPFGLSPLTYPLNLLLSKLPRASLIPCLLVNSLVYNLLDLSAAFYIVFFLNTVLSWPLELHTLCFGLPCWLLLLSWKINKKVYFVVLFSCCCQLFLTVLTSKFGHAPRLTL